MEESEEKMVEVGDAGGGRGRWEGGGKIEEEEEEVVVVVVEEEGEEVAGEIDKFSLRTGIFRMTTSSSLSQGMAA